MRGRLMGIWAIRWQASLLVLALVTLMAACFDDPVLKDAEQLRYIASRPAGNADGSSWANAASLKNLPNLVAQLSEGGEILIRADEGPFKISKPIHLGDRGSDAPLTIRGVDHTGQGAVPLIIGGRDEPYSPESADTGRSIFALEDGADHLTFEGLAFKNVGNGCFVLNGAVRELTISDVTATNVRRFIENPDDGVASVEGLVVRRTTVQGFSKDAVRLQNDTHDVFVEDVMVDSQGQDGDRFAIGFHLTDTVHDVVFRRVIAKNAMDTLSDYHNGDGFAAERETYDLRFEETKAINNMDAGYDIKSSHVTFVGARAFGNKRNFRLWGTDLSMKSSRGVNPIRRGGSGSQAQVWAGPGARFVIDKSQFVGGDANTIVFSFESGVVGKATHTTIKRAPGSLLSEHAGGVRMTLNGESLIP